MWNIDYSDEYNEWFDSLGEEEKSAVLERVILLQQIGPNLPRPYTDVLHGSKKYKNLKELRNKTEKSVLSVSYYFDPQRNAYLLIGGDKKGKDEDKFYKDLIKLSEQIIERHEKKDL
ncbi:type II toxin-antitoxin system RelE/ParE family toxin [Treponema sp.]|uniref:type II toxin-antitoxin system RelE/ParE family toxin n=1 Tax=Treponema sp. TaxID=166 RepID=UPI003FD7FD85